MLAGDVHPEDSGPNAEPQRRIQDERLAVDASRDGLVRINFKGRGGPLRATGAAANCRSGRARRAPRR